MTPSAYLATADLMLTSVVRGARGAWPRACSWLLRHELEAAMDRYWARTTQTSGGPPCNGRSFCCSAITPARNSAAGPAICGGRCPAPATTTLRTRGHRRRTHPAPRRTDRHRRAPRSPGRTRSLKHDHSSQVGGGAPRSSSPVPASRRNKQSATSAAAYEVSITASVVLLYREHTGCRKIHLSGRRCHEGVIRLQVDVDHVEAVFG
ncbi:MAG: hypothetical protein QOH97_4874 [Actinoplanes sp.]|nr:hypothetical protein [Actinoplanes sp.]